MTREQIDALELLERNTGEIFVTVQMTEQEIEELGEMAERWRKSRNKDLERIIIERFASDAPEGAEI